jgi:hypothetical protein
VWPAASVGVFPELVQTPLAPLLLIVTTPFATVPGPAQPSFVPGDDVMSSNST